MAEACASGDVGIIVVCVGMEFTSTATDVGVIYFRRVRFLFASMYFLYSLLLIDIVSSILSLLLPRCNRFTRFLAIFCLSIQCWFSTPDIRDYVSSIVSAWVLLVYTMIDSGNMKSHSCIG